MKRKIIDEKGKIFGVISAIDILVVIVLVVLGAAVYVRFFSSSTTAVSVAKDDAFTYQLNVQEVRYATYEALRVGDYLYDKENGTKLGQITDISCKPAMGDYPLADGTIVYAPVVDRYEVLLTISAEGMVSNGRYYASRIYEIMTNSRVEFYTKYCITSGLVWTID